ncbi:probable glutamate receptor isoform X1 [Dermacentor albipictus]
MVFTTTSTGSVHISGLLGDILRELSQGMRFNYSVAFTPERTLGIRYPNGSWTGLIGSLQRDEGDFALGLMIPTNARNSIANPTTEVYIDEISILAGRTRTQSTNVFSYVLTFDWQVWVCVLFTMMTLSLFSTGLDRFYAQQHQWATGSGTQGRKRFHCRYYVERFLGHAWEYFENLLGKGSSSPPSRQAPRVVTAFWWLAVTVLVFAFAGQMRACLMVKSQESVIRNIQDLARRSSVRPYTLAGSILTAMLRDSRNPAYQRVFERIMRYGGQTELHRIYGQPILEQVVRGKAVVIADRGSFTYKVASTCRNYTYGEFYIAEEPLLNFRFVMYLSKKVDVSLQRGINQRLVWLREMGIMDRWIAQMLGNWDHCRRDGNRVTLTFEDTYAIFVMWALLVTASLAAFGFEKLRYAYGARKIHLH